MFGIHKKSKKCNINNRHTRKIQWNRSPYWNAVIYPDWCGILESLVLLGIKKTENYFTRLIKNEVYRFGDARLYGRFLPITFIQQVFNLLSYMYEGIVLLQYGNNSFCKCGPIKWNYIHNRIWSNKSYKTAVHIIHYPVCQLWIESMFWLFLSVQNVCPRPPCFALFTQVCAPLVFHLSNKLQLYEALSVQFLQRRLSHSGSDSILWSRPQFLSMCVITGLSWSSFGIYSYGFHGTFNKCAVFRLD